MNKPKQSSASPSNKNCPQECQHIYQYGTICGECGQSIPQGVSEEWEKEFDKLYESLGRYSIYNLCRLIEDCEAPKIKEFVRQLLKSSRTKYIEEIKEMIEGMKKLECKCNCPMDSAENASHNQDYGYDLAISKILKELK